MDRERRRPRAPWTLLICTRVYPLLRRLLFQLPPETAHRLANAWLRVAPSGAPHAVPSLEQTLWGLWFPSPLGLAAGMDKGAVLAPGWFSLGFGWVEIGTITPLRQRGNPRPRLFRLPEQRALINRMGFNNDGAAAVAERLRRLGARPGPICVNIGRNKDTPNERAADDYAAAARALAPHADILAINASSPNTPGLRELQSQLGALVAAVRAETEKPVLVKLSPDEPDDRLAEMARAAESAGAAGVIATNTTVNHAGEQGGLSGAPLRERALQVCKLLYRSVKVPVIGVGGISSAEDAYARVRAGASLFQLYTALIYEGPSLPRRINHGLAALLARDGLTLRDAIGRDAR